MVDRQRSCDHILTTPVPSFGCSLQLSPRGHFAGFSFKAVYSSVLRQPCAHCHRNAPEYSAIGFQAIHRHCREDDAGLDGSQFSIRCGTVFDCTSFVQWFKVMRRSIANMPQLCNFRHKLCRLGVQSPWLYARFTIRWCITTPLVLESHTIDIHTVQCMAKTPAEMQSCLHRKGRAAT